MFKIVVLDWKSMKRYALIAPDKNYIIDQGDVDRLIASGSAANNMTKEDFRAGPGWYCKYSGNKIPGPELTDLIPANRSIFDCDNCPDKSCKGPEWKESVQ